MVSLPSFTPVTFPLHPLVFSPGEAPSPASPTTKDDQGREGRWICTCWKGAACKEVGKHPAVAWRDVSVDNPSPGRLPDGGVALKTGAAPKGSGIIVIDIDTKEAAAWFAAQGPCPETLIVATGRPGIQYYFQHPGYHISGSVGSRGGLFPGLDVRGDGNIVVMPGSRHKTGRFYKTHIDKPIVSAPEWLLTKLKAIQDAKNVSDVLEEYEGDVTDPEELERRRDLYITFLDNAPPSIQGQGGDEALFHVVQYGAWDLALPTDDVLELIETHFDDRCDPPWADELEERVLYKCHYAKTNSTRARRVPVPADEKAEWDEIAPTRKDATEAFGSFLKEVTQLVEQRERVDFVEQYKREQKEKPWIDDCVIVREPFVPNVELIRESIARHYPEGVSPPPERQVPDMDEFRDVFGAEPPRVLLDHSVTPEQIREAMEEPLDLFASAGERSEPTAAAPPEQPDLFKITWGGGWSDPPLPPTWLINNVIGQNKVTMIYAEPGSIKTWLAISFAIAVGSGTDWLGARAVEQGRVLYIDYEDGEYEFRRRVHLLAKGKNVPDVALAYSPGRLDDAKNWTSIAKMVVKHSITFLVVDTMAGGMPGVDENSSVAAVALQYAGQLTEAIPSLTVLFLHHANRAGDIRGSSAFKANVDSLFKLVKDPSAPKDTEYATLSCVKSGQKKVHDIDLQLTDRGGVEIREEVEGLEPVEDTSGDRRTLDELRAEVMLTITQKGPIASSAFLATVLKAKKTNINAVLAELGEGGHIVKMPDGWVADSASLRRERVRDAIRSRPEAGKARILSESYVDVTFFDRLRAQGHVRQISSESPGFVWIEKP